MTTKFFETCLATPCARSLRKACAHRFFQNLSCHALRAACAQQARSVRTSCAQRARSLRTASAQRGYSKLVLAFLEHSEHTPCAHPLHSVRASFAQLARSVRNVERAAFAKLVLPRRARSLRAACRQHARSSLSNVDRIFQTLSNPIFIELSSHNKKTISSL